MKTLEDILQKYFGLKGSAFCKRDCTKLTRKGDKAFTQLDDLLYDLQCLTGLYTEDLREELNRVVNEPI